MYRYLLLKIVAPVMLLSHFGSVSAQETYYWQPANLLYDLPFSVADSLIDEYEDGFIIELDAFDLEIEIWPVDSVMLYFEYIIEGILSFIIEEYELIVISSPQPFPLISEGSYVTAIDTFLFTDSLVLGVFFDAGSEWIVVALIDCWEIPLETGVSIMKSMRFRDPAMRQEE